MNTVVLQTKDSQGKELWISRDEEGSSVLFCLDCNFHSLGGRDLDELPRYFRTTRGARMAAAIVTGEKLDWTVTDAAALNKAGKSRCINSPPRAGLVSRNRPLSAFRIEQGKT